MVKIVKFFNNNKLTRKNMFLLVFLNFCIAILSLAQPEVLKRATNAIINKNTQLLINTIILTAVATILNMIITYGKDIHTVITKNKYEKTLSSLLLDKLITIKMSKINKKQFGDISTVLIRNVESYVASAVSAVSEFSTGVLSLTLTMIYMLLLNWRLALCVLVYNIVIRSFAIFVERKIKKNSIDMTEAMKDSGNYLVTLLTNMFTVRIYSNRDFLYNRFKKKENQVMRANLKSFVWSNGYQDFIWAFSKAAEFFIVYGVGVWLILRNIADVSILLTYVFANDLFTIGINNISNYSSFRAEAEAYQESLEEILIETELEQGSCNISLDHQFQIRFVDVSFSYGGKQTLKKANFTINPGEKVLLQGANGTGKSTILKLLAGLYRPDSGEIFYGNENINNIHISGLAKTYGYISQHSNMMEGDAVTNIALNNNVEENHADEILRSLNLSHIQKNDPRSFSQGEQQRLNIGRLFYRINPAFIMGDEIFANIDEGNRNNIIEQFHNVYKDATIMLITHEQIGYKFDRVLTVTDGKVVEEVRNEAI
ncbi:MAG: msbA4 [Herbinix sp.]|jgi:ATP-binding cassette subfamily B protein|nr:msbA4 [Herbinix sp.]